MRHTFLSLVPALALAACSSNGGSGSTGGSASSTSASTTSSSAGTGGSQPTGAKITAPEGEWTWVPFDDAFCADGSTTGIGVNLSKTSSRVVIYLEGGGACWSDLTCYTLMTASNFTTGYSAANFTAEATDATYLAEPGGFFDRTAAANPFKDYSYVYVPYCTGDIHAGNNVFDYGGHKAKHVGFANVAAYLKRVVPTFPAADRVYLTGSSAGGFGAAYNWWQTQEAFGKVRVDLIDDSGTPMPPDVAAMSSDPTAAPAEVTNWGLATTLPPGCTGCLQSLDAILPFYRKAFPNQHGALLAYTQDSVLPTFFGITTAQFTTGLNEELSANFAPTSNLKAFTVNASGHVLWFSPLLTTNGVTLQTFLTQMVNDDAAWASVTP